MKKTNSNIPSYISPAVEMISAVGSALICLSPGIDNLERSEELDNVFEN
ncbi:MAG: hypothetical protein MJY62_02530 [Bacteroidales bacterium]|mgnify:CR=1 FL=1|nr:hypothetical protein [Bacteroidales bacterium]